MRSLFYTLFFLLPLSVSAQSGQVKGKIVDATNNESIAFATIVLFGTNTGMTSDIDGNFTFTGLEPGYIQLQISYLGYTTYLTEDILITPSKTPFVEVKLETGNNLLEEVVVKADPFTKRVEAPLSMQTIGVKEIEGNPGSNRDISRVIQSFPGVGSTPAFRNDVLIRGGGPSENRFFLDDIEIPVLNHFSTQGASGGPVGIINADFIRSVDFYSASFPASKYNALSGVLDFRLKEGNKDKTAYQFSLGASEAAFTMDGPLSKKTNYIFSARRSYLQFLFSAIGLPFLPTFNDYQLKVKTNFDTKNQLTIISIGSLDDLNLNNNIEAPDASQEYILSQIPVNNQWSYTIGGVYKNFFDNGNHSFVLSRNMLNNEFYKYPDNDESREKTLDYNSREIENKFRYELNIVKDDFKINVGSNLEWAKYDNQTSQQIYRNGNLINFSYDTELELLKYGLSAQASKRFFDRQLLISAGVRWDGNNYNNHTKNLLNQTSPRLSLSYVLAPSTSLNAGIGRYFQQPAYTTLGFKSQEGELINQNEAKYIGLNQYNLGIEHKFNRKILFSVEGFYKDYFQYPIDQTTGVSLANQGANYSSVSGASEVLFNGTGRAIGIELLNRWNYDNFNILAAYTYVNSSFSGIDGDLIPSAWDSRHLFTLTASTNINKTWRAGLKWRYVGGLPYTPYDLETSANVNAWDANGQAYFDFTQLNSQRFEPFHQLDIRVDKSFYFNKWSLMLYLDIQNAYNFQNQGQDYIIRTKNEDGSYLTTNNGSQYVLESIANKSGTILPTIGIMVKL